jgi:amidase
MSRTPQKPHDTIGAFVPHSPPPIAGADDGPLVGLGFAVKDLFDISGHVTGGGSPAWLASHTPAHTTSPLVTTLLAAGADLLGKTVCDELFYSVAGENAHYGTPHNMRAPGRIPGGSSSGSAAAVAAVLCDFALGSDTGGSVRVPASFCGLYGLRPSHGRVSLEHALAMAPSFDTAGWFTRDAASCAHLGRLLLDGPAVDAPVTRVLIAEDAVHQADASVQNALRAFIATKREYFAAPSPVMLAPLGLDTWRECLRIAQGYEIWQQFGAWVTATQPALGPGVRERMEMASRIDADSAARAAQLRATIRTQLESLITPGTVVLLPSAPCIAPPCQLEATAADEFRRRTMALTCSASLSGLPQLSVPALEVQDCPVGLSLMGWRGGDQCLLDFAATLAAQDLRNH